MGRGLPVPPAALVDAARFAWLGRPAPRVTLEIRRLAPVMIPHNDENRVVGWQDRQVPVEDPAEPGAMGPEQTRAQRARNHCSTSWRSRNAGIGNELELSHTRHILYQTEEELHVTNRVLVAVQYENQQRRQQIERIRGPRVAHLPECPICFDTYTFARQAIRSRILHCGHTVYHTCVRVMLESEATHRLHCPLCRFKCMVIAPEYLPLNWALF